MNGNCAGEKKLKRVAERQRKGEKEREEHSIKFGIVVARYGWTTRKYTLKFGWMEQMGCVSWLKCWKNGKHLAHKWSGLHNWNSIALFRWTKFDISIYGCCALRLPEQGLIGSLDWDLFSFDYVFCLAADSPLIQIKTSHDLIIFKYNSHVIGSTQIHLFSSFLIIFSAIATAKTEREKTLVQITQWRHMPMNRVQPFAKLGFAAFHSRN